MADSSNLGHGEEINNLQRRLCDFCGESIALLYCRADSAKLCLSCDRQVHSTNQLFTKHTRLLLCDSCDSSPASLFCCTHNSVLCQDCYWETQSRSSSSPHDRRPLEGFSGCPSVNELLSIFGFEDFGKKQLLAAAEDNLDSDLSGSDYGFSDFLVWDTPSFVSLDDLIVSSASHNFQAMGVPSLPKNRNAVCGEHKVEILNQLRELAKLELNSDDGDGDGDINRLITLQPKENSVGFEHNSNQGVIPLYEMQANSYKWRSDTGEAGDGGLILGGGSYNEPNNLVPETDSDNVGKNGGHDEPSQSWHEAVNESIQVPKVREFTTQERDTALSRYKEKKKTRRYDKLIRYESRKVRAESRTRIKGRFAKKDN